MSFLARSAKLLTGLYILLAIISSLFIFYYEQRSQYLVSTGPIFTIYSPNGRHLREFSRSGPVFFPISQGTLPWQPI